MVPLRHSLCLPPTPVDFEPSTSIFLPQANALSPLSDSAHFYSVGLISEEGNREIYVRLPILCYCFLY